ncbi:hypothetical protein I3842_15G125300, partial [Carya illinoinensis]
IFIAVAEPNSCCVTTCGSLHIPHPFGTSHGCYLDPTFLITCNSSSRTPTPFLKSATYRWTANSECLLLSPAITLTNLGIIPTTAIPFSTGKGFQSLPKKKNKFTAIGCDTAGVIASTSISEKNYASGCVSLCDGVDSVVNGTCSGAGCCQTSIPQGLNHFAAVLTSVLRNYSTVFNFNPCGFGFVVEEEAYNFSSLDLQKLQVKILFPWCFIDWAVGNQTCENCMFCYYCVEDIDECKTSNPCVEKAACINHVGYFNCSCPDGYEGDGRREGTRCCTTPKPSNSRNSRTIIITLGITISLLVLLLRGSLLLLGLERRKLVRLKEKFFQQNGGLMLQKQISNRGRSMETTKIFSTNELKKATNNYDESNILGKGGYGTVYKGLLPDNKVVAIKKSKICDQNQTEQFINKVIVLTQVNHRNVVKLLGCCLETEVPLLVYEFITNGTLSDHIHDESRASSVSWVKRMKIAAETAKALAYLHAETSMTIIHRDVKSTNILLDDNHTAKVADFGASRLVALDQTQMTTLVQGTLGYLDPEYFHTSQLTEKSDMYSFGVVLAELLTGEKAISSFRPDSYKNLAMYFVSVIKEDRLLQILEDHIVNDSNIEVLKEVASLATRCLRVRGEDRPYMTEVAMELEGLRTIFVAAAAEPISSCNRTCGSLHDIPYPFGTSEGCYLDSSFLITCNSSSSNSKTSTPTPFLSVSNIEVLNISLDGELRVSASVARDCPQELDYNSNDGSTYLNLREFPISYTKNVFTAVGCDTLALIGSSASDKNYTTGCVSLCDSIDGMVNGSCSGFGCCQTPIPDGIKDFAVSVGSLRNHSNVGKFNPCGFAFVVEKTEYNFSTLDLQNMQNKDAFPLVLDWAIGNQRCEDAKTNTTGYACKADNSECYSSTNGPGYRCNCFSGYHGNPYLSGGCQGISISLLVLLLGGSSVLLGLKRRKLIKLKEKYFQQNGGLMLQEHISNHGRSMETTKIFSNDELKKATNNYDENRVLGKGGYGTVYKGVLADNKVVAIKKSKICDNSQIEQFINEVILLTQINHRNVVKLIGCCLETEVPLLVYEFITNGTLSDHIHDISRASFLSSERRLKIAIETARALAYLHSETSMPIIHRDVKSTNILLDDNYTAKVADFGASRLIALDQIEITTLVQGTLGYLDPEYFQTGQLTEKSDVYSFGVVLAELLTGEEAISSNRPESYKNLAMYFGSAVKEDRLLHILEDHIVNEGNIDLLKDVANLTKRCLRLRGEDRPTMMEVAMELEGLRIMKKHPWGKDNQTTEETEYLLSTPTLTFNIDIGIDSSASTTGGHDSMINQLLKPHEDGR